MTPTDPPWRELLLGRLSEAQAARLEEALFTQDGFAEQLREAEYDLLDDYAGGRLSDVDRIDVERHVLGSARDRHALLMARAMAEERARQVTPENPGDPLPRPSPPPAKDLARRWRHVAPVGALLAAGLAAVVWIPRGSRSRPPESPPAPARSVTRSGLIPPETMLPVLTLLAETERGTATPVLHWRAGVDAVTLQAEVPGPELPGPAPQIRYSLRISGPSGLLFESPPLSSRTVGRYRFVEAVVPSAALGAGARSITLTTLAATPEVTANYIWHVIGAPD